MKAVSFPWIASSAVWDTLKSDSSSHGVHAKLMLKNSTEKGSAVPQVSQTDFTHSSFILIIYITLQ